MGYDEFDSAAELTKRLASTLVKKLDEALELWVRKRQNPANGLISCSKANDDNIHAISDAQIQPWPKG